MSSLNLESAVGPGSKIAIDLEKDRDVRVGLVHPQAKSAAVVREESLVSLESSTGCKESSAGREQNWADDEQGMVDYKESLAGYEQSWADAEQNSAG